MDEEVDSSLVPASVPLELARAEVDSIMTSVDVTDNSAYWSLEQPPPPQRMSSLMSSSGPVSGADTLTKEKSQFISPAVSSLAPLSSVIQQPPGQGRLVGVPTLGRVIPMAELSRSTVSEMRIVLQPEPKIEDDITKLLGEQASLISESTGMFIRTNENNRDNFPKTSSSAVKIQTSTVAIKLSSLNHPEVSQNKLTDKSFPSSILECYLAEYKSGQMYDAVWECDGGRFKVHRLVLASVSPLLKLVLSSQPGDVTRSVIFTPELSAICVKSLLCLFYTGKVNISGDLMTEVNMALKMLQFHGENVALLPSQSIIKQESDDLVGNFKQVSQEKSSSKTRNQCKDEMRADSDEDWDPKTDLAFDDNIQGDEEDALAELWKPAPKRRRTTSTKPERWGEEEEEPSRAYTGFRRGRKSLKTPDTAEIFRTRGPGKGERSAQLSLDLFDGRSVDFIHVCHGCYKVFDRTKEFTLHKDDCHPEGTGRGPYHTSDPKVFDCPKCNKQVRVKHIAWFAKHLKFCRVDTEMANNLVTPDDVDSDGEETGIKKKQVRKADNNECLYRDSEERLRITGEAKGKNVHSLSNVLYGKIVDFIWGCKICYSTFLSEDSLETHKAVEHDDKEETNGEYWNPNTENYTCPHCKQVQNSRHLVWFIYHMKKCNMNSMFSVKKEINDTEDETDNEDAGKFESADQHEIVFKPYEISTERAEWICQSLLGRIVQTLYPCNICYQVYESAETLSEHFGESHKGSSNRVENGPYYDSVNSCFHCPICGEEVCKSQTSSIKYIYHYKKCSGQVYSFKKSCQDCEECFTHYKDYKSHTQLHNSTGSFMCHLCTKHFPSNARLNYHVQYVHSTNKPYKCDKCEKSYKRKAELQEHEEMSHSTNFNYSCEKCGKQFYGKKNLALHMKTHYSDDEKKHVCNVCGHRFAKIKFLKNHMTVHSDVRKYACEVKQIFFYPSKLTTLFILIYFNIQFYKTALTPNQIHHSSFFTSKLENILNSRTS